MRDYYKYWKTTKHMDNPVYDKRRRHGLKAREAILPGTVLRVLEWWQEVPPEVLDIPELRPRVKDGKLLMGHEASVLNDTVTDSFLCPLEPTEQQRKRTHLMPPLEEWAEPYEPTPVEWYRGEHGRPDFYLKRLLEKGLVTRSHIREIGQEK